MSSICKQYATDSSFVPVALVVLVPTCHISPTHVHAHLCTDTYVIYLINSVVWEDNSTDRAQTWCVAGFKVENRRDEFFKEAPSVRKAAFETDDRFTTYSHKAEVRLLLFRLGMLQFV